MRRTNLRTAAPLLLLAATLNLASTCDDDDDDGGGGVPPGPVSFAAQVWPIVQANCMGCHSPAGPGGMAVPNMDLSSASAARASWVNQPATTVACTGGARVVPLMKDQSVVYHKVINPPSANLCGPQMPFGGPPLADAEWMLIGRWIDDGANP